MRLTTLPKAAHLRGDRQRMSRSLVPYMFIAPSFLLLCIFVFYPLLHGLYLSFHKWSIIGAPPVFVGISNYRAILSDDLFLKSLTNTLYYTVVIVPIGIVISLSLAILMNRPFRFRGLLRGAYFFPNVVGTVITAILWIYMYDVYAGVLNHFLVKLGLPAQKWLHDPRIAMPSIIIVGLWHGVGYNMVILLAGLQAIPSTMYEAAAIDGATRWQAFWRITLPLLRPVILFVLITSIIGSFKVFDYVYTMTGGGPGYATIVFVQYIYQSAFTFFTMGYASSLAYVFFAIILLITMVQLKYFGVDSADAGA